jgi:topoisomerase-4 subunit B
LTIIYNGEKYFSDNGLKDLLDENIAVETWFTPIIHLKGDDIEVAITTVNRSTVKNTILSLTDNTPQGTHLVAFERRL